MAIFKDRFTREDLVVLLVYTAFPIHVWTIVNMLKDVPSWALYMRYGELLSTVSYTLVFALFETIIILFPIVLVGLIVPVRWLRELFVPWAGLMLFEGAFAAIAVQEVIVTHGPIKKALAIVLIVMAVSTVIVIWSERLKRLIRFVAERLAVLSLLYIFVDLIGLVIVVVRNV